MDVSKNRGRENPQNGWWKIMENPIKMDDLGVPPFLETPIYHGENAGTLGMVPLIINPIYTLYSGYLLGISPFKRLLGGLNS